MCSTWNYLNSAYLGPLIVRVFCQIFFKDELKAMLGIFKEQKNDTEIKETIASKDTNRDGEIELNEMIEDMK